MKTIAWIATTLSLIGIILNAYMIVWCWAVWMLSNIFWIHWSIKKKEPAQTLLWIVFLVSNIFGWYNWLTL